MKNPIFPHYRQLESSDCGPTCLRIICKHFGKALPLEFIKGLGPPSRTGYTLLDLQALSRQLGFDALLVECESASLKKELPFPCVVLWNKQHFAVIYDIDEEQVYMSDPGFGLIRYRWDKFIRHAVDEKGTFAILLLEPTPAFFKNPDIREEGYARIIARYISPLKKQYLKLFIVIAFCGMLEPILPWITRTLVDEGVRDGTGNLIRLLLLGQFGVVIGRLCAEILKNRLTVWVASRINITIISRFLKNLMNLPLSYFERKKPGDIMQRIADQRRIELFLSTTLLTALLGSFSIVALSVSFVVTSFFLFTTYVILTLIYFYWIFLFADRRRKIEYQKFNELSLTQTNILQIISGMQDIKIYGAESSKHDQWVGNQTQLLKLNLSQLSIQQYQDTGAKFINEFKTIVITYVAAIGVIDGNLTLGAMMAILVIVGQLNVSLNLFIGFFNSYQDAKMSLDRLTEVDQIAIEYPHLQKEIPASSIRLANISFGYRAEREILRDVSLTIPKVGVTAIVGSSGSGKSTIIKLILGFYRNYDGQIIVGNRELGESNLDTFRTECAAVLQDSYIFSDTILGNITMGTKDFDSERLEEAISITGLGEVLKNFPLGIHTKLGTDGHNLSHGQKQRILLARAIYKDANYIFLDEATNSLDHLSEDSILAGITSALRSKKSIVIISHRISSIKGADQIIVLSNKTVAAVGDHYSLLETSEEYRMLSNNPRSIEA